MQLANAAATEGDTTMVWHCTIGTDFWTEVLDLLIPLFKIC